MGGERPANATAVADEEREGSGITIEILQQHFHQPLVTVAEELGVSLTVSERREKTRRDTPACCRCDGGEQKSRRGERTTGYYF